MLPPLPLPKMPENLTQHERMLWMCQHQTQLRQHYEYQEYKKHQKYLDEMTIYNSRGKRLSKNTHKSQ